MDESGNTRQVPLRSVSRRTMLLSVAGVVVGTVAPGIGSAVGSPSSGSTAGAVAVRQTDRLLATTAESNAPVITAMARRALPHPHAEPAWGRRWNAPIYDIDDFLHRDHTAHYPRRSVMLTIDDGPSPEWTPRYLRLLARHHVRATFNMIGEQVAPNRHLVRAVASEGHAIANHTWTHDEALPYGSREHISREIVRTNEVLHDVAGYVPTTFRAPGGVWGPRVFDELARLKMMPLGWDIDPRDWARPGVSAITSAMLAARHGNIILCHDGGGDRSETYAALKTVIPALLDRGLRFITLPT